MDDYELMKQEENQLANKIIVIGIFIIAAIVFGGMIYISTIETQTRQNAKIELINMYPDGNLITCANNENTCRIYQDFGYDLYKYEIINGKYIFEKQERIK